MLFPEQKVKVQYKGIYFNETEPCYHYYYHLLCFNYASILIIVKSKENEFRQSPFEESMH